METISEGCRPVPGMSFYSIYCVLVRNSISFIFTVFPAIYKKRLDRKFANIPRCSWSTKCRILLRGTNCETFSIDCFELRQISGHATVSKLTCQNYGVLIGFVLCLRLGVPVSSTSFQNFVLCSAHGIGLRIDGTFAVVDILLS